MPRLQFKGRVFVENHHFAVPYHELVAEPSLGLSERASLHDNLIVHGDNLVALKALLPAYAGKVKCIYIDPPYNTGNEGWAYNDAVNSPMIREWFGKIVDSEDLTRHDKWCCMMLPRLKLLWELLREDGLIFVSIDDHEVHHLRMLMDEVFGERNFFAQLTRRAMHTVRNSSKDFNLNADYVLAYGKNKSWFGADPKRYIRHVVDKSASYPKDDKDGRGPYKLDPLHARNYYKPYEFTFENGVVWSAPEGSHPRYSKETLRRMESENRIGFSGKRPMAKRYLAEVQRGRPPDAILRSEHVGFNLDGTQTLSEVFQRDGVFSQPKPVELIKFFCELANDKDAIVLDSFAGSGTTAHAVLERNREDGGNRRFVLVECEDYADAITAERVRRVIRGVPEAKTPMLRDGLGGAFSYFRLGDPMRQQSLLDGALPTYETLAAYVFFTATGVEFDPAAMDRATCRIGETQRFEVFLIYDPDVEKLKNLALDLEFANGLPRDGRNRLVFAPSKYLDPPLLLDRRITFMQLPFEIYETVEKLLIRQSVVSR